MVRGTTIGQLTDGRPRRLEEPSYSHALEAYLRYRSEPGRPRVLAYRGAIRVSQLMRTRLAEAVRAASHPGGDQDPAYGRRLREHTRPEALLESTQAMQLERFAEGPGGQRLHALREPQREASASILPWQVCLVVSSSYDYDRDERLDLALEIILGSQFSEACLVRVNYLRRTVGLVLRPLQQSTSRALLLGRVFEDCDDDSERAPVSMRHLSFERAAGAGVGVRAAVRDEPPSLTGDRAVRSVAAGHSAAVHTAIAGSLPTFDRGELILSAKASLVPFGVHGEFDRNGASAMSVVVHRRAVGTRVPAHQVFVLGISDRLVEALARGSDRIPSAAAIRGERHNLSDVRAKFQSDAPATIQAGALLHKRIPNALNVEQVTAYHCQRQLVQTNRRPIRRQARIAAEPLTSLGVARRSTPPRWVMQRTDPLNCRAEVRACQRCTPTREAYRSRAVPARFGLGDSLLAANSGEL